MRKLVTFLSVLCLINPVYAVNKVSVSEWGFVKKSTDPNGIRQESDTSGEFKVKWNYVDMPNGKEHAGDNTVAYIAMHIVPRGGCFVPVDLFCEHKSGDRHDAHIRYFKPKNSGGSSCIWLCADGYAGADCANRADETTTKTEWEGLSASKRSTLEYWGDLPENFKSASDLKSNIAVFDAYEYHTGNRPYDLSVVLGVTDFLDHGVKASPVAIACWGDRYNNSIFKTFKGIGRFKEVVGDTKLLCPSGYKPNSVGTDCEEIKVVTTDTKVDGSDADAGSSTTVNTDTSIVREETPDGSVVEYTDTKKISQIDALKSQSGYNSAIHSVYNYAQDDKNPKFAVFCKDDSTGLESPDSLNCVACTSSLRRGVCLENNPGFGVCVQCGVGKVYDKKSCKCVNAVAYSMKDLAFGENEKAALNRVCWAKDDNDKYRECVFWDESKKKTSKQ